jgi:F-type H+-transporting ATPase subunit b
VTTFIVGLLVMLIILWLIYRYLWPKLNEMMTARQEEIGHALSSAEEARQDAASAEVERAKSLDEGRAQAAEIVAQARRNAEQVAAEAAVRTAAEQERIIANAQTEVQLARQRAVDEAAALLGDVVMDVVTKVIDREADAQVHAGLVNQAMEALAATTEVERAGVGR